MATKDPHTMKMSPQSTALSALLYFELEGLLNHVGGYWTGKESSTFVLALVSSESSRKTGQYGRLVKLIKKHAYKRCLAFLHRHEADESLATTLKMQLDNSTDMRKLSEFFAFVDYIEGTPKRIALNVLQPGQSPNKLLWMVGTGTMGGSETKNGTFSPVMLSTPTWRPELLFLAEKWLDGETVQTRPRQTLPYFFPRNDLSEVWFPDSVAVLHWKDIDYLDHMHHEVDIAAGMIAHHSYGQDSNLHWIPRATREIYEEAGVLDIQEALDNHDEYSWLSPGIKSDLRMPCSFMIRENDLPSNYMDDFGSRIIKILREAEDWYPEDDAN